MHARSPLLALAMLTLLSPLARADFSTGSTGADGALNPTSNTIVDLRLAGTGAGHGVYDSTLWAVVFNYTTVTIPTGVTVTFVNHASGAPVIWLATGDVRINGTVSVSGAAGGSYSALLSYAAGGPGGFEGGHREVDAISTRACSGFGPGGGPYGPGAGVLGIPGAGGGYGTNGKSGGTNPGGLTYGDEYVLPLIGGSGGAGGTFANGFAGGGGGGGGGALLIASPTSITVDGSVAANGGAGGNAVPGNYANTGGPGSGGAIRLRAPIVNGVGQLRAVSGAGSADTTGRGRIRVEATTLSLSDIGIPTLSGSATPNPVFPDASAPRLRATFLGATPIPGDPLAGIATIDAVTASVPAPVPLTIQAENIAPGTTVEVYVTPDGGAMYHMTSSPLTGTLALSTATVNLPLDRIRRTEIVLRANTPGAGVASPITPPSGR